MAANLLFGRPQTRVARFPRRVAHLRDNIPDDGSPLLVLGRKEPEMLAGPNVSSACPGAPESTARAFFNTPHGQAYRTGDRGQFRDDLLYCKADRRQLNDLANP